MSGVRGFIAGIAGLALLEVVVADQGAADRAGGIFTTAAGLLSHWLDPNTALVPDLRSNANPLGNPPGTKVESLYQTPRRLPAQPQPPILSA